MSFRCKRDEISATQTLYQCVILVRAQRIAYTLIIFRDSSYCHPWNKVFCMCCFLELCDVQKHSLQFTLFVFCGACLSHTVKTSRQLQCSVHFVNSLECPRYYSQYEVHGQTIWWKTFKKYFKEEAHSFINILLSLGLESLNNVPESLPARWQSSNLHGSQTMHLAWNPLMSRWGDPGYVD